MTNQNAIKDDRSRAMQKRFWVYADSEGPDQTALHYPLTESLDTIECIIGEQILTANTQISLVHLRSLIRAFTVHLQNHRIL